MTKFLYRRPHKNNIVLTQLRPMSNQNWNGENNRPKDSHSKIDFSQFIEFSTIPCKDRGN